MAYLEKGPLEKSCRCSDWCHWGSPCLLSLAGVCVPAARGTKRSALHLEFLVLPVPPCPASRRGHTALLSEQPVHLPVCLPVCFSPITAPASQPRPHSRDTFVLSLCSVPPSFQLPAFLGTGSGQLGSAEHEAWCGMAPWDTACPPSICQPLVHVPAPLGACPAHAGEVGDPGWLGATRALCPSASTARTQP